MQENSTQDSDSCELA